MLFRSNSTAVVNGITYTFNSSTSSWTRKANTSVGVTYTASSGIVPPNPKTGDQWYNILEDVRYEYATDGTTFFWLDTLSPSISTTTSITSALQSSSLSPFLLAGM